MKTEIKLSPEQELLSQVFGEPPAEVVTWFQGKGPEVEADLKKAIDSVLATLKPRYAESIRYRFGLDPDSLPLTYKAIGVKLSNVTPVRARQIVVASLRLLRHPSRMWMLARFTPHYDPVEDARRSGIEQAAKKTFEEALALYGDWSIEKLDWTVRTSNVLSNACILTISDLCKITRKELLKRRNLGRKCLREVEDKLEKLGLRLAVNPHVQLEAQKRP